MAEGYPVRYWWVVLVAVPLLGALIAVLPDVVEESDNGSASPTNSISISDSDIAGDVQIVENQVLIKQLTESGLAQEQVAELRALIMQSQALSESSLYAAAADRMNQVVEAAPSPAAFNNLGALRMKQGDEDAARAAFDAGLALDPAYEPLQLNFARLHLQQGNAAEAISMLAVAGDSNRVDRLRSQVEESIAAGVMEREPNDDLLHPNVLPLGQWLLGTLSRGAGDHDVYRFVTDAVPRDYVAIELKNRDTALRYTIALYDGNKRNLQSFSADNSGQDGLIEFSAQPNSTYLVSIAPYYSDGGSYRLRASHQHRYDAFEPNDDLMQSQMLPSLTPVRASAMDARDKDYYAVPLEAGRLTVRLISESQSFRSVMTLFSPQRKQLTSVTSDNQGQNIALSHTIGEPDTYFLSVQPYYSPGGSYRIEFELD